MVSIIIPNYNGKKYLERCVNSIYAYSTVPVELIIIDNGSVDDNFEWLRRKYPQVILVRLDQNYGFSYAVNRGIKLATAPYVILLNNDTQILPGFVENLLELIKSNNKIFSAGAQMLKYDDPTLIDDAGDEYTALGWTVKRGEGQPRRSFNQTCSVFSSCAGAAIYRKDIFKEIGYFDRQFFAYMEDVDICYRARNYGYTNLYCPRAKVLHIGSATSGSKYNTFKIRLAARNNIYVPYKNMPLLQLIFNLPLLIIGILIKAVFFTCKGFGDDYVGGIFEGLASLHKVTRMRYNKEHLRNYIKVQKLIIKNIAKILS
ncbi:MAG: hypothetical protein BEN18_07875 [Epulopiscium sp. Nuni2H_MBin001]|nr:MAG: hypothetical protein BEN18_07875 [Epulopiscium sp. Nuni2H_MBin001]